MSPAVVLAIVIATQNVDDQATEAMRATAAEAVGGEDSVVVREVEAPSDREALRIERTVHAHTVAQVIWLDAARTRAQVRVHVAETNRWTERTIVFSPVDTPNERGRAMGFAVTSMLPEEALAARPHQLAARPAGAPAPGLVQDSGGPPRTALRIGVIGSLGPGGSADGIGVVVAAEFLIVPAVSLRMGGGVRQSALGSLENVTVAGVPVRSGTDLTGLGGIGVAFWPLRPAPGRRIAVGIRVDALLMYHSLSAEPAGQTTGPAHGTRWLPGLDALAEVGWSISGPLEIITSVGAEAAFGNIDLTVADQPNGKIAPLRAVGEAGIRVSF